MASPRQASPAALTAAHRQHLKESSGLTDETIASLGWRSLDAAEVSEMTAMKVPSGGILIAYPGTPDFWRVRLDEPMVWTYQETDENDRTLARERTRTLKYLQPKGSANHAFIMPEVAAALASPQAVIAITEGEKKAAKATQEGVPTIGLGGVWSFLGKRKGEAESQLLAELDAVDWTGRQAWLFWDSDARQNGSVLQAGRKLRAILRRRGANARFVAFQDEGGARVGLDDFFVNRERQNRGRAQILEELWAFAAEAVVGEAQCNFAFDYLEILDTDPPRISARLSWGDTITGLEYEDLMTFRRFTLAVVKQTHHLPTFTPKKDGVTWEEFVSDCLETVTDVVEAPEEAKPHAVWWERIGDYLRDRATDSPEQLLGKRPYREEGTVYFNGSALLRHLNQFYHATLKEGYVWDILRRHGAQWRQNVNANFADGKRRNFKLWAIAEKQLGFEDDGGAEGVGEKNDEKS